MDLLNGHRQSLTGFLLLIMVGTICAATVFAGESKQRILQESINAQMQGLDFDRVQEYADLIDDELKQYLPEPDITKLVKGRGGFQFDLVGFMGALLSVVFREVVFNSKLLGQVLALAIVCAILEAFSKGIGSEGVQEVAYGVCGLILIFITIESLRSVLAIAGEAMDNMVSFLHSLLPFLSSMLVAVGAFSSAAIFHPLLITASSAMATVVRDIVFPLIFTSALLGIVGNISTQFPLSRLSGMVRQTGTIVLGMCFTVFLGIMVVKGAIAPVADGVGLRTAKYLTGAVVPVIGGLFSQAVETVVGASMIIKNGVGIFGLIVITGMVLMPLAKIFSVLLIYKLVCILSQPVVDTRLVKSLSEIESSLDLLLVAVASVALVFFIAITVIIGLGNVAVMVR